MCLAPSFQLCWMRHWSGAGGRPPHPLDSQTTVYSRLGKPSYYLSDIKRFISSPFRSFIELIFIIPVPLLRRKHSRVLCDMNIIQEWHAGCLFPVSVTSGLIHVHAVVFVTLAWGGWVFWHCRRNFATWLQRPVNEGSVNWPKCWLSENLEDLLTIDVCADTRAPSGRGKIP